MKERHRRLIKLLNEKGELDIDSMVRLLKASPATVRRDLAELHEKKLITRTLGGGRLNNPHSLVMKTFRSGAAGCAAGCAPEAGGSDGARPPRAFSRVFWKAMFLDCSSVKFPDSLRKTS